MGIVADWPPAPVLDRRARALDRAPRLEEQELAGLRQRARIRIRRIQPQMGYIDAIREVLPQGRILRRGNLAGGLHLALRVPGVRATTLRLGDVLPQVLASVAEVKDRPRFDPGCMARGHRSQVGRNGSRAIWFQEGVLVVSDPEFGLYYSLLSRRDQPKILSSLRSKFPNIRIADIVFRMASAASHLNLRVGPASKLPGPVHRKEGQYH